ncbi:FAD-dependent oxidoreductase [Rhodococcus sp. IEGM 1381]|uniref:NAD(P)/FAD-dependent oxidoreductase n=1 Tax=Rhodococcus sp. IEGM 1381 TaxID=3047085 RepID=UPI0024B6922F|nr:FAD-dependent oxidoreductase [Rhodococcus sp. IEGM 1381]MDI9897377.1 FAD-dependent oxidoreductase [Rhodococcus sp. IEGM 1381]
MSHDSETPPNSTVQPNSAVSAVPPGGRIVVVGASLAGLRAAEGLRAEGYTGEVVVIGDEAADPYDRPPLSKEVLTGVMTADDVLLMRDPELDVTWELGRPAIGLNTQRRVVEIEGGKEVGYDQVVLATGSRARTLPTFGHSETVHTVRTVDDALRLRAVLGEGTRLLVIGCGFIGVEVASSARTLGADVTMVGLDAPLAPAGPLATQACTALLQTNGVVLHTGFGVSTAEITESGAHRVTLSDGTVVDADQVVVACGSMPNVEWLETSGLPLDNGVVCGADLRVVGFPDVFAAGDIARWPHPAFGASLRVEHWSNAVEQGQAVARAAVRGESAEPFAGMPSFWSDHFGVRLQGIGALALATRFELTQGDVESGRFAAAAYAGDTFVGGVAYGIPRAVAMFRIKLVKAAKVLAESAV